jgi:hypothetical protein
MIKRGKMMKWIRRDWTAAEADEWTKEDWITIILSPLSYILIAIGFTGSLLLLTWGYITLILGVLAIILMHWIINPKLKMISSEYEKRQKEYLIQLEKTARWEDNDG